MLKFNNLVFDIDSSEIFLNVFKIYNDNEKGPGPELIKKILNNLSNKEISDLLRDLKISKYLKFVSRIELVLRHIISENLTEKYKNNKDIFKILYEIFIEFTKINNNNQKDQNFEGNYHKCIYELISLLVHLNNNNYSLSNDFFDIITDFIKNNKNEKSNSLFTCIFRALFFELFETSEKENSLKYIENSNNFNLFKYKVKQINSDLYKYLENIIDFLLKFKLNVNKEIISELFYFIESIYIDYAKNMTTKNHNSICIFNHIFTKKIMKGIFEIISEYQKNIIKNLQGNKYSMKEELKNYDKLISFLFHNNPNPGYFFEIKDILEDKINFKEKIFFVEEIIGIISKEKEDKKDINKNKIFYQNSIALIDILYTSSLINTNLSKEKEYENIYVVYFNFLKENKFLFSQYLIPVNENKKTALEYCVDLSIQIGMNIFIKLFHDDNNIQTYILKGKNYKEKNYENNEFNKYLKSLKFKISEKPIILHIIDIFITNKNKDSNFEKYLNIFIDEIKKNSIWKKYEKDNEEIRIINNNKNLDLTEFINNKNKKKIEIKENILKTTDIKKNISFLGINENECPLKKNCLLSKNKNIISSKETISKEIKIKKYGTFSDINLDNIILCIKRDLLLKECSAYFYDMYFEDKNFKNLKRLFLHKYLNHPVIKLTNKQDKLNCPVILKNYSNNQYAYPQIYFRPYTSFYNQKTLNISHSYFDKNIIKKPSFPYFLSHYHGLKSIIENLKNEKSLFESESELIIKMSMICGNLFLKKNILYFINNDNIKLEYKKNMKYLFSSLADDVRCKEKIIIIKINEIEEIIVRRYLYDYRAFEIFLKNGKSYYFNLYSKDNLKKFFDEISKLRDIEKRIIRYPKKAFEEKNYYKSWIDDQISTYQYLLYVNKFSSRSFNDINQYPIFPWIFRESSLGSHRNKNKIPKFRDLRYPISMKGNTVDLEKEEEEKEEIEAFFESSKEESKKYPSHFRLHYSTSGYLLSFLVRVSPYTEEQIIFQNNQFDSPSRQLNSIDEILTILSTSHDNRELIPEYFTTVEFYLNMNYVYFGFRLNDKLLINDVVEQENYFKSVAQYAYYNRLILNIKLDFNELFQGFINKQELKINSWIDLIFGYKQWNEKPKKDDLNLFGKYSYNQYINFDKILDKFEKKKYDEKTIIEKIEKKKLRIINFGQCPEVLFNKKHKENYLPQTVKGREKGDDMEDFGSGGFQNIFSFEEYEKELKKNFNIVNFWVTDDKKMNSDYIYFLAFEEKNHKDMKELYLLIYKDQNATQNKPEFVIKINEINLFSKKNKIERRKKSTKRASISNGVNAELPKFENTATYNLNYQKELLLKNKFEEKNSQDDKNKVIKEYIHYYNYKLSPKNCIFEICSEKRLYFFVGRNIDNSIKIYEVEIEKEKEGKLRYNIPMDSFVSCVHKINKYRFFTGHKNGKIFEFKIDYNIDKKNEEIKSIEIIRDLIAHKDSMVCCINYIKKHNILLTSSNDGNLFIRKYFDFELLSIIQTRENINRFVYTDYDLLYLLISPKGTNHNKSYINIYTLNGLLLETSELDYYVDIEPMKNGKIFCNIANSCKLGIFGFNENIQQNKKSKILNNDSPNDIFGIIIPKGNIEEYDIIANVNKDINNKDKEQKNKFSNKIISDFYLKQKNNIFYIYLENKYLVRQMIFDFNSLYKGIQKLKFIDIDNKDRKISTNSYSSDMVK